MIKNMIKRLGAAALCALAALSLCAEPALATENGAYTASTSTYYINPDTGHTDDAGGDGSTAIGEGMCRSVLGKTALVEIDGSTTYVTLRINLLSNLSNLSFAVQQTAGDSSSYRAVSPSIMAENAANDTADYRFAVPKASSYIRCTAYVMPMSRDVVFYLNVSGALTAGGGDFVVSVSSPTATPAPTQTAKPAATASPSAAPTASPSASPSGQNGKTAASAAPSATPSAAPSAAASVSLAGQSEKADVSDEPAAEPAAAVSTEPTEAASAEPSDTAADEEEKADAAEVSETPDAAEEADAEDAGAEEMNSGEGGLSGGAVAGIVAAVVVVLAGVVVVVLRRRRK